LLSLLVELLEGATTAVGSGGGQAAVGRKSLSRTVTLGVIPDTKGRQNGLLG
jgi:hypothetical protein